MILAIRNFSFVSLAPNLFPGGVVPSNRLMGMCRWMGSHFNDWIYYNVVALSIVTRVGSLIFGIFGGNKILVSRDSKIGKLGVMKLSPYYQSDNDRVYGWPKNRLLRQLKLTKFHPLSRRLHLTGFLSTQQRLLLICL